MPTANSTLVHSRPLWIKLVAAATWLVFLFSFLLLDSKRAVPIENIILAVGVIGFVSCAVWLLYDGRWRLVCAAISVLAILLYVVKFTLIIEQRYAAVPQLGIGGAISATANSWFALLSSNVERFGVGLSLLAAYTDLVMGLVQILVFALLLLPLRAPSLEQQQ